MSALPVKLLATLALVLVPWFLGRTFKPLKLAHENDCGPVGHWLQGALICLMASPVVAALWWVWCGGLQ